MLKTGGGGTDAGFKRVGSRKEFRQVGNAVTVRIIRAARLVIGLARRMAEISQPPPVGNASPDR